MAVIRYQPLPDLLPPQLKDQRSPGTTHVAVTRAPFASRVLVGAVALGAVRRRAPLQAAWSLTGIALNSVEAAYTYVRW